jgi:hypothetical protein
MIPEKKKNLLQKQQQELEKELEALHMITDGNTPRVKIDTSSPSDDNMKYAVSAR